MAISKPLTLILLLTIAHYASSHNITQILDSDPNLSEFNSYLTKTKLADEIDSRETITVLAIPNSAMSSLPSNLSLGAIKKILSLHVVLDYYDAKKLHSIHDGTVITTTLYQTTGQAQSQVGEVNITDVKGGGVKFGSAQPGSKLGPVYVKEIKQIPFNISVIEISAPIIVPSLLTSSDDIDVIAVLEKAGCKTFAALLTSSGVLKAYETQIKTGITVFAPNDEAFKAKGVPDLNKLSDAETVSLLQFHALTSYAPIATLKTTKTNLQTLAPAGKYGLTAKTAGDSVTLHTGVDSSRVASTLLDATPVAIYSVDNVLLPVALFGLSPAPAPAPESDTPAPAPAPEADSPVSPSSPPAPASMETPAGAPDADGESPKAADDHAKKNGGGRGSGLSSLMVVVFGVILLVV